MLVGRHWVIILNNLVLAISTPGHKKGIDLCQSKNLP
jgi:hypothetical protein